METTGNRVVGPGVGPGFATFGLSGRFIGKTWLYLFVPRRAVSCCGLRTKTVLHDEEMFLDVAGGSVLPACASGPKSGDRCARGRLEYVVGQQPDDNRPVLVEFFFSASEPSRKRIPVLDDLARRQAGKVSVVLLSREGADKIVPLFEGTNYAFAVALDDEGKTFDAYGVKFVPFSVLLDAKGRVLWFGNSSRLTSQELDGLLAK